MTAPSLVAFFLPGRDRLAAMEPEDDEEIREGERQADEEPSPRGSEAGLIPPPNANWRR